jgi:hypothetical protein
MRLAFVVAAALIGVTPSLVAQSKPDVSGTWVLSENMDMNSARTLLGLLAGLCGQRCDIAQDATSLTVTRTTHDSKKVDRFILDGQPHTSSIAAKGATPPMEITTTAKVVEGRIEIDIVEVTKLIGGERRMEVSHVVSLGKPGLIIQTSRGETMPEKRVPARMEYTRR